MACFQSYLEGQRQFVKLGHITSEPKPVRQKIPQGSIVGPVLFLLLVNDMPLLLNNSTTDIRLIETAKSVKSLGLKDNATNQIRMKIYSVHIQTAWVETKTVKK